MKIAWSSLLDALQSGDAARIRAAGAPFVAITANANNINALVLNGLAISGYADQTVDAYDAGVSGGGNFLTTIFRPPFSNARKPAKFAALAAKMGLIDCWQTPGHRPDFYNEPNPAALCAAVSRN